MGHLVVRIAIQVHASEVVPDHCPLAEPICATVDDPEATREQKANPALSWAGHLSCSGTDVTR